MDDKPLIQQYLQLRSEFMGYLYAITRSAELSEEVYQNAAVIVMEQAQKDQEPIRNFRAWAKEVVRRQALNAIRARGTSPKHVRSMAPELLGAISEAFLADESHPSVVADESTALKSCLGELPAEKRQMLAMRYESGATFDEISIRIGSTPTAVQRSLSRIRKLLHGCIQGKIRLAEGT